MLGHERPRHDREPQAGWTSGWKRGPLRVTTGLKFSLIFALLVGAIVFWSIQEVAHAEAIAFSSISFSNLTVSSSSGTINFAGGWTSESFAEAENSLGEVNALDSFPQSTNTSVTQTATFATASGNAAVTPSLSGGASTNTTIPGSMAEADTTGTGTLSNFFTISGASGSSVNVSLSALISYLLNVQTDAAGVLARTETIFSVDIDGTSALFSDTFFQIGSSSTSSTAFGPTLISNTISLDPSIEHLIEIQADSESQAIDTPEPSTVSLLFAGLGSLAAWAGKKRSHTA